MQEGVCVFLFLIFFWVAFVRYVTVKQTVWVNLFIPLFFIHYLQRSASTQASEVRLLPPAPSRPKSPWFILALPHAFSLSLSLIVLQGTTKQTPLSPLLNFRRFKYSEEVIVLNCYLKLSRLPTEIYWCCSLILSSYVCVYKMWFMCVRQYKCVA